MTQGDKDFRNAMDRCHHALPFGAELQANGRTRFRVWAPDAKNVALAIPELNDRFELRAELPKNESGKIMKEVLRAEAAAEAAAPVT